MKKTKKLRDDDELDLDSEFDGLDDAEVTGKLPKLKGGGYRGLRVDKVAYRDGYYGRTFIIEFTLLGEHLEGKHRTGQRLTHTIGGFGKKDREHLAFGNLKNFLAAAFDKKPNSKQQWAKTAKECVVNPELIQGKLVNAEVDERETEHANPLVIADFQHCDEEYDEDAPAPKKSASKSKPSRDDEDEEEDRPRGKASKKAPAREEEDEDEDDEPAPRSKSKTKKAPAREEEDDEDEDEDDEPAPRKTAPASKSKKRSRDEDEDLDL